MFRAKLQNSINLMASERDTSCFNLHYSPQNNILTILLQILITQISTIALMGVHTSKGGQKMTMKKDVNEYHRDNKKKN